MQIEVLLFAALREAANSDSIRLDVADDARAADVIEAVSRELPQIAGLLPSCRLAVDSCYVTNQTAITGDSEFALIPPVSGG